MRADVLVLDSRMSAVPLYKVPPLLFQTDPAFASVHVPYPIFKVTKGPNVVSKPTVTL